jgi:tetratricopeptide (TPR) repeat protein
MSLGRYTEAVEAYERALEFGTPFDEDVLETVPLKLRNAERAAQELGDA